LARAISLPHHELHNLKFILPPDPALGREIKKILGGYTTRQHPKPLFVEPPDWPLPIPGMIKLLAYEENSQNPGSDIIFQCAHPPGCLIYRDFGIPWDESVQTQIGH